MTRRFPLKIFSYAGHKYPRNHVPLTQQLPNPVQVILNVYQANRGVVQQNPSSLPTLRSLNTNRCHSPISQHGLHRINLRHILPIHSSFSTLSSPLLSGHSRWSKIKHDKAKVDASKTQARSTLSREITIASKLSSPNLDVLINRAKSLNVPKVSIEAAIARGQGLSPTGASLQQVTIEFVLSDLPGSLSGGVAGIVECMVENKARIRQDVLSTLKHFGAKEGVVGWMFDRKGRVVFRRGKAQSSSPSSSVSAAYEGEDAGDEEDFVDMSEDTIFDTAIEANALDVDLDDDEIIAWTEPQSLSTVAEALENGFGAKRSSMEMVWEPQEFVMLEEKGLEVLRKLVGKLEEESGVVGVWLNADLDQL